MGLRICGYADIRPRVKRKSVANQLDHRRETRRLYLPVPPQSDHLFLILVHMNFFRAHTLLVPDEDQHECTGGEGDEVPFGVCRGGRCRHPPRISQSSQLSERDQRDGTQPVRISRPTGLVISSSLYPHYLKYIMQYSMDHV